MTPNPDPSRALPRPRPPGRRGLGLGLGYQAFVAWRYLLVSRRKIRRRAARLLFGGLAALAAIGVLHALHVEPGAADAGYLHDPLWLAGGAAVVFVLAVGFIGILRHSKPSLVLGILGLLVLVPAVVGYFVLGRVVDPGELVRMHLEPDRAALLQQAVKISILIGSVVVGLAMLFGTLRGYFTFFTTVPIGGVWIGTAALVIVLSVMGGFETDLREKILGSNAHLQITREEGDFVNWREIKARIDKMPGVVASTPYAVSEVVIAANNAPMNVLIKGIDPKSVGQVTDLVSDLEDRDAMRRLEPLVQDDHDLRVPQPKAAPAGAGSNVMDPAPPDMPAAGDPIDYSKPEPVPEPAPAPANDAPPAAGSGSAGSGSGSRGAGSGSARGAADGQTGATPAGGSDAFGGDAVRVLREDGPPPPPPSLPMNPSRDVRDDHPSPGTAGSGTGSAVIDPAPPDMAINDEPPTDYSRPDYLQDAVKVIDPPFDTPSMSRRTQSLPGMLVGRELVKQTHLYTGEEVRVVSPLSDPANPDANGTPIPYNRDYRVAGTFFTGMYEYDLKYVYVTLDSLLDFLSRGDAIDGIEVRVVNPYDTDAFVAQFRERFGSEYRVQDWKELNRSLFTALKLEKIAMFLVLGIVILVASFSIVGNLIMVVVEKAREIALLKTLGASDTGVMMIFAIQGLMIGLIGVALGVATGLLGCWALSEFGFPLNENVYYIDRLPVHVDPLSVVAAAAAGIVISILATLYPAIVAARVAPAAGMRH